MSTLNTTALLRSIQKDLKWRLTDPMSLVLWIGIPLFIGGLMSLVTGGGGSVTPKAHLLLADQDDTLLTRALAGAADNSAGAEFLAVTKVQADAGRRRIDDGDGSAFVILPAGFTQKILDDEPVTLELVTNPSQRILPKILQEGLEILVEASFYVHRLAGDLLAEMTLGPPAGQSFFADVKVAAIGVQVNQRLQKLETVLFPPVLTVEDELTAEQVARQSAGDSGSPGQGFNMGLLMFPGIVFMAMMFMAQGMSYDVWREKDQGTLARLLCSPTGPGTFVLAKTIAGTVAMACVAVAGLVLGVVSFGLPATALPIALAWTAFSGATLFVLFLVLQMLASSSRGANVLTTAVLFPLMMVGGTFFPFESMPQWMADIGRYTPNGIAVTQLKSILSGHLELTPCLIATAELGLIGALLFVIATRRLRGRFASA